jgi:hypothetical protein
VIAAAEVDRANAEVTLGMAGTVSGIFDDAIADAFGTVVVDGPSILVAGAVEVTRGELLEHSDGRYFTVVDIRKEDSMQRLILRANA